jgi:uncharacterized membrane protein YfcA
MSHIFWSSGATIFVGFGVGTLIGLTGVGGGSILTPVLMMVFGLGPLQQSERAWL